MKQVDPTVIAPDVMRAFGCAMYGAQLMEEAAVNFLLTIFVESTSEEESSDTVDEKVKAWEGKTFGGLIRELEETIDKASDSELADQLIEMNKQRNRLAHHFLREHLDSLISPTQHGGLIRHLENAYKSFLMTANTLNERTTAMSPGMILSDKEREELVEAILDGLE